MDYSSAKELKSELLAWRESRKSIMALRELAQQYGVADAALGSVIGSAGSTNPPFVPGEVAVGVSLTADGGYRLALRLEKMDPISAQVVERAQQIARDEIDVKVIGAVRQQMSWTQGALRPPMNGCSFSHYLGTAGTLGCFVKDRGSGALCALSNNHVIMRNDTASVGDALLQPGPADSGTLQNAIIGRASRGVPLAARGDKNYVDAAIGTLEPDIALSAIDFGYLKGVGRLASSRPATAAIGDRVAKVGRTTKSTWGRVVAADFDNVQVRSATDSRVFRFDDQIEIEGENGRPFSEGGDSGSLVVNEGMAAVGLVFCGSDGYGGVAGLSYANHISRVLDELAVDIVS